MPQSALRQIPTQSAEPVVRSYNPFNPAFRDTVRSGINELIGGREMGGTPTQRYRAGMADMLTGGVDVVPGLDLALGVTDTVQAARGGNYGTAAMLGGATMLGMLPIVGDVAGKAVRGALRDAPDASDSGLVTRQLGGTKVEIRDPANPGLRLTLVSDPEEGPFMSPYLEILGDKEQIGGRGTATKLYLEGLARAQAGGLGWQSDSILSDSSYKMYDRLKNLGVPFSEATVGPKYSISAADLANVDINRIQSNFLGRQSPSPLEGTLDMSQAARMQKNSQWKETPINSVKPDYFDGVMDANQNYEVFGLRVVPRGFEANLGDRLPVSKDWDEGIDTGIELDGTSAIGLSEGQAERAINQLLDAGYDGDQIVLIGGKNRGYGQDAGEVLIGGAEVLKTFSMPRR